ncbi:MAG: glutaredoxin [Bdellovibrionales bacterium]|nr:glutaredoxin [Bdellovibrionales bacterium]
MKQLKIYYANYCPFCRQALGLLGEKDFEFEAIDVMANPRVLDQIKRETGHPTIPIILIDGELIGGYTELKALDRSGELDKKMRS